ncbi:site-specific integrase [Mycobacterium sp. CVI_P3]|uniref:Site-specific integrase n=1 Tax=Mycobacterium pinniadriaticum TaxID=2994102 RepID=A0ABT3SME9_9MYCO|nr:site-specific integrase [Mycobacterium pinniadriaticum]MCX2934265.1 site-specific integrase [Mycobacterium pinniadriaticum]MCX2940697.1 site-specific integrase [Mycobacterium pinniadriaticum]
MGSPDRVCVTGPLAAFSSGFAAELVRLGYRPNASANQLQLMAHLSRWMMQHGLAADGLTASVLADFLAARRAAGYRLWLSPKALTPLLEYLRGVDVTPVEPEPQPGGAVETLLARYRGYLVSERGLSAATAALYAHLTRPLLASRMAGGELDVASLTAADVIGFVRVSCPGRAVGTAKLIVTAVRSLLGFLHVEGVIGSSLASAVPSVAGGTGLGVPRGLDPDAVARLLACCDRSSPMGRRDYAMLVLLARLGLRPGEVCSLRLDDIDWRAGELVVTGKGHRIERLPLPVDVGEAVADYLRDGRPATADCRTVFVRFRAPHRSLSVSGVTDTVHRTAARAGLGCIRARVLRHTAATAMVQAGAALPEVGQVLRHRRLLTTSVYAKVDIEGLRELARPWPGGAA